MQKKTINKIIIGIIYPVIAGVIIYLINSSFNLDKKNPIEINTTTNSGTNYGIIANKLDIHNNPPINQVMLKSIVKTLNKPKTDEGFLSEFYLVFYSLLSIDTSKYKIEIKKIINCNEPSLVARRNNATEIGGQFDGYKTVWFEISCNSSIKIPENATSTLFLLNNKQTVQE